MFTDFKIELTYLAMPMEQQEDIRYITDIL